MHLGLVGIMQYWSYVDMLDRDPWKIKLN
jgi:hypothetical protein